VLQMVLTGYSCAWWFNQGTGILKVHAMVVWNVRGAT